MYRFVICVDIEAGSLEAAYRELLARMGEVERISEGNVQWESSDEVYTPDGDAVDIDELSEMRMLVLMRDA